MKFYRNVFLIGITFLCGVTVRGWGAFHHQPLWGFDCLTQKVTRDSLQKNLFGQTAGICHVQYINNLRIVGVCDPRWNRVITFGYDAIADTLTYIWGTAPGSLFEPWDIDGDNVDKIYVADAGNNRVATFQIYEAQTQKPGLIDLQSYYGIGILSYPQGVDVQGSKLYVSDTRNHRIVVFDVSSHQVITTFGSYGSGDGQFNYPIGIAVKDTFIYIADTDNKRIVLLKELPNGTLQWIRNLSLPGVWTRLWSLDVDSHGKVYAIDYGYHRIIKIAGDIQQVINYFGSYGVWGEHFFEPSGISMRPDLGKVLITECWSDTSGISNWRLTVRFTKPVVLPHLSIHSQKALPLQSNSRWMIRPTFTLRSPVNPNLGSEGNIVLSGTIPFGISAPAWSIHSTGTVGLTTGGFVLRIPIRSVSILWMLFLEELTRASQHP